MSTPLYKSMKTRGTSFYCFPSSAEDMNLAFQNDSYKINFSKFALLNIPEQVIVTGITGIDHDQNLGVMNFDKDENGPRFYNFQPGGNNDLPQTFGEQLIESLRNYVANYDAVLRESRINSNTEFYNVNETVTPTEMIFWKWCRKLNLIDWEPALHKIDWDKNLSDFDNLNGTGYDYFRKYLWKERDVNYYSCTIEEWADEDWPDSSDWTNKAMMTISQTAKFKVGDVVLLSGNTGDQLTTGTSYTISDVIFSGTSTHVILDVDFHNTTSIPINCVVYLDYHRLVNYIGEIQAISKVQTSRRNFTEVTAQIPHQCGKTPTVLFGNVDNLNYEPGLEMPILPAEQQVEIVGSENTNSPIRINPQDYVGTYYGYFDTEDKTYLCSTGDKIRYSGDYYGVQLTNNIGLDSETYVEKLTNFNSNEMDGVKMDFDRDHYLKMNLPDQLLNNFDEFNSAYLDGVPEDFDFNAILWYYQVDDGSGNIVTNLYGIEFLNNPSDDDDECDINNRLITPYKKKVSNGDQDGNSYIFNLNINFDVDNDVLPLSYDPTTVYNQFSFDLYQKVLQSNALIQENFMSIISGFTDIHQELFELRSLIYSQTQIDTINSQIDNLNDLLKLYSTFQFVNSTTAEIETNFTGTYPTLKVNVLDSEYAEMENVLVANIFSYNETSSGLSYAINVPNKNRKLININNNNNSYAGTCKVNLQSDLNYLQAVDIYLKPNISESPEKIDITISYYNGFSTTETSLLEETLPVDLSYYDALSSEHTYLNSYYNNENVYTYSKVMYSGTTINQTCLDVMEDLFDAGEYLYIDNFKVISGTTVTDLSGIYQVTGHTSGITTGTIEIDLNTIGYTLKTYPKISYYRGWKINILRINESDYSSLTDRYQITKTLL